MTGMPDEVTHTQIEEGEGGGQEEGSTARDLQGSGGPPQAGNKVT